MISKQIISGCMLMMSLCATPIYSAESTVIDTTVTPYYNALKNGDVVAIEQYIADPLYSNVKARLQSDSYPDFLRRYYTDSYIEVINVFDQSNEHKKVYLNLYLSATEQQTIELNLHKSSTGDWKVTSQSVITE